MSYRITRNLLFKFKPETSHHLTMKALHLGKGPLAVWRRRKFKAAPVNVMGVEFPNPVGLAAGLDKNGECIKGLQALGFGFIEIGTVTPQPQSGNPKPRLFRIVEHEALINRMGFNGKGVEYVIKQIKKSHYKGILGINIGKNLTTPLEKALDDYLYGLKKMYPYASYITVNLSSPNTPGLRELQYGDYLDNLLGALKVEQSKLQLQYQRYVPLAVKIAPDLSPQEIKNIAQALQKHKIDAVIATNTTLARVGIEGSDIAAEQGGLSGVPLFDLTLNVVKQLNQNLAGGIPIIACGGISNAESAKAMLVAGASLVQIYTGFIYRGPKLISDIVEMVKNQ